MPTILISGAASGLGRAFLNAYANEKSNTIIAIDKENVQPSEYQQYAATVQSHIVDVTSEASINSLATLLSETPIDLFIHSVGIRGLVPAVENAQPESVAAAETLHVMDLSTLMHTFQVNAAATFLLLRSLLPNLKQAHNGKVVIMSSRMGSIGHNTTGSAYAYRASKAALNSIIKSFSIDVPEVVFVLCHPGRVESKLVKYKEEAAISAEESVAGLFPLVENWNKNDSGQFYDRFGQPIVW
ncbi:NAD(P)-binding protein [Aureobasidium pullulans]|uniref:NAD(P)-binding protein n=1 Tax=Aureobasidium pullulans TaxID=5580 RepID=A0AB38MCA2_AURPU|nr:NAD(P)-binding protein [Aureobasidium pullulans]THZ45190.1 NAD(P)-binding protein [Aureobasidium pullulans]THZ92403.1 NAD(P)-binding protein [Aureobasidium pullulans]